MATYTGVQFFRGHGVLLYKVSETCYTSLSEVAPLISAALFRFRFTNRSTELLPRAPVSALRGHDYKLLKRHCRSHARSTFFSFRGVTLWNNLYQVRWCLLHRWILSKEDWTNTGATIAILWIRACLYRDNQWTANRSLV